MLIARLVLALVAVVTSLPPSRSPAPSPPYYGVPGQGGHSVSCCQRETHWSAATSTSLNLQARRGVQGECQDSSLVASPCAPGPRSCRQPQALSNNSRRAKERIMSKEQDNKAVVGRWFTEFWGSAWNPAIVDELCTP